MNASDINDVVSEAGIVASAALQPELVFYSEQLTPHHFSSEQNAYLYYAICELVKRGVYQIDAYNITNVLSAKRATKEKASTLLTVPAINDFLDNASAIARTTAEEYRMLVDNVMDAAFRRETYAKLGECQNLCLNSSEQDIQQKIYSALDGVMLEYSTVGAVPQYKDVVDDLWREIEDRQDGKFSGMPFKFPTLNQYASIEPGELFIFAAEAKQGKSMMLLNCAVDLMRQGKSVLYIDSELNSRMFTCRLIAHLSNIEFSRVKSGRYTPEEGERINLAIQWLKQQKFTHLYMPMFDVGSIYTTVKKVKNTQGLDVIIIDYIKSRSEGEAFASYQELGKIVD